MKKLLLMAALLWALSASLYSQVVFRENFMDFSDNWADHPEWTIIDGDKLPAGKYIGYEGTIWVHPSWRVSTSWHCAMSNSRFVNPGKADNWMILPEMTIPEDTPYIKWKAWSLNETKLEDYQVLISTNGKDTSKFTVLTTIKSESIRRTQHVINLSDYAGKTVYIAFRHISFDKYLLCLTDIEVSGSKPNDLALTKLDLKNAYIAGKNIRISGTIANKSADTIKSFIISWQFENGQIHSDTVTVITLKPFVSSYNFEHKDIAEIPNIELYKLKVWISAPNGKPDGNHSNDSISTKISGLSKKPVKNVLIEEGTGTWCVHCPKGAKIIEKILSNYKQIYAAALHLRDSMETENGKEVLHAYITAYPRASIDRVKFSGFSTVGLSRAYWEKFSADRRNATVPADIDVTADFDNGNRELTIEVTANFYGIMDNEYRLNAYVLENGIPSAGTGYVQKGADASYIHQHVVRAMLGGAWGTENSIPVPTKNNGHYKHKYVYTLPANYKVENIHVYGLVQQFSENINNRPLINLNESELNIISGINGKTNEQTNIKVYPVPASSNINIAITGNIDLKSATINVYSVNGNLVKTYNGILSGTDNIQLNISDLPEGNYFIELNTGTTSYINKITKY
jgi:hypothetical protein